MKKKILAVLTFLSFIGFVSAQDYVVDGNSIKITKVIENTNLSIDQENEVLLTHLAKTYNDINTTLKTNTTHNIIVKGVYPDVIRFTMGLWSADLGHQIAISLKEGRVRVEVSISKVHLHSSHAHMDNLITNFYPINQNASAFDQNMVKSKSEEMLIKAELLMKATILEIENALKNHAEDDNW